jgi:hypothetical protein
MGGSYPGGRSPSRGESRPGTAPSRLGRRDVRPGPPRRLFEIAPVAAGCRVAAVLAGVMVVELVLSLFGDYPKDAEVYIGQDQPPRGSGIGIETASAAGNSGASSQGTKSLNPTSPSAPVISCGGLAHSGQARRYVASAELKRNRQLGQAT